MSDAFQDMTEKQRRNQAAAQNPPGESPAQRHAAHQQAAAAEVGRGLAQPGVHRPAADVVVGVRRKAMYKVVPAQTDKES
jgi:hypothetical protein